MDYFFVSPDKVRQFYEAPPGLEDLDASAYVTRKGALKTGTPFFLGPDMRPAEPLCSFFQELAKSLKAKSLSDYTYDALDLVDFLEDLDLPTDLLSATEDDLVAYREDRTVNQESPISAATWQRRRALINNFYDWAVEEARLLDKRPYYRRKNGKDVLAWGDTSELDVRHLSYEQWRFLKQVGLRGLLPGDRADRNFRVSAPLRNSAAGELAVTTGMRLREFSTLLDIEVGQPRRDGLPSPVELQATAKYSLKRVVEIQYATLREIDLYRRTEREWTVRKAAKTLHSHRAELFVVDDIDLRKMKVSGILHGRRRTFRVSAMTAEVRRLAVIEGDHGLEPMALFVGRGGRMLSKQRWNQIFDDAHARTRRICEDEGLELEMPARFRIHDLRHTFAVIMLELLTRLVLEMEAERRRAGHDAYLAEHINLNALLMVQRLLGHKRVSSTMRYLRYIRRTNLLVARAIADWNDQNKTYAEYASRLTDRTVA
ncbi:tyrosine-type recombinase/integrase [Streptomyces sp. NPDC059534]|uniref:tyrosine-type recombinase/integrase n=1 Tax=Streptomyces sp. NPDC059534 TaxID=3346859 RepID=UPI0036A2874E